MKQSKSKTQGTFQVNKALEQDLESNFGVWKETSPELERNECFENNEAFELWRESSENLFLHFNSHFSRPATLLKRCAYTLAEVVLVMLVIAIIVGISIKITKTKLDNIMSVNYYYAYKTLDEVVVEMNKRAQLLPTNEAEIDTEGCEIVQAKYDGSGYYCINFGEAKSEDIKAFDCNSMIGQNGITEEFCNRAGAVVFAYAEKMWGSKVPAGSMITDSLPNSYLETLRNYNTIYYYQYTVLPWVEMTAIGIRYYFHPNGDKNSFASTPGSNPFWSVDDLCYATPCTFVFALVDELEGVTESFDYCEKFSSFVNTKTETCKGDQIAADVTDFSGKNPDIVLRNGVRLFNISQDPVKIQILDGNARGSTYTKTDGTEIDIDEWGYTVYVDIDGESNGQNTLWEDVYPFYVTLSGKVIPAYDADNAGESGGDSINHLQTSVSKLARGAKREWVVKSKTFKESACKMGYVKGNYCGDIRWDTDECPEDNNTCSLKTITPLKYF